MKAIFLSFLFLMSSSFAQPRVLHLTLHQGCKKEIENLAGLLNFELETWYVHDLPIDQFDGKTRGADRYNIDANKAKEIWRRHKDFFEQFDLIITSDTTPLSRIFLQNNFKKPLIIWVCNRFDYCDEGSKSKDSKFPDRAYYNLIRNIPKQGHVKIFSYTPFEHIYAQIYRKVDTWNEVIKPLGVVREEADFYSAIPLDVIKEESLFIPPYHNDTQMMNLSKKLTSLGLVNYCGRYNGPYDLKDFKGIVHIPYAWSNLALFEGWACGMVYFIPSPKFLLKFIDGQEPRKSEKLGSFFWSPPFNPKFLESSEWYTPEHRHLFIYFDSWEDLVHKVATTDYETMRCKIKEYSTYHQKNQLDRWKKAFDQLGVPLEALLKP